MRKVFVFLLCMLALIAFASCTNDPHNVDPEPTPAPTPTPEPDLDSVPTDEEHAAVLEGLAYLYTDI